MAGGLFFFCNVADRNVVVVDPDHGHLLGGIVEQHEDQQQPQLHSWLRSPTTDELGSRSDF